ncbi:eukaryotic translation initiation factor 3 subunit M [Aulographum hederae CBS 113979]|uniref:Eukaryotic translation initiation factor 3 subunit M n=1 Tax=Aulographum hederae CBS 113979 TaxID=1176131 RepID=A0A6G1H3I4_9PEZI|nr:eukaryotic translation initiation factor 3 subunit M [Aulographum hederae CBS 113979]
MAPTTTLLIEGSFEELIDELSAYIDNLRSEQGKDDAPIQQQVGDAVKDGKKDDALKKLVSASDALNGAPEKELTAAYNLLIHIVKQADNPNMYLARICQNLSKPITSSPVNGAGLALSLLSTVFNVIPADDDARYHALKAIVAVIQSSRNFETLKPQLKHLDKWLETWEMDEEDQRSLYISISDVAKDAEDVESSYQYLIRALRTIPSDEASSKEAQEYSLRALKAALNHPTHFDFQDLTALDSIQALRNSEPVYFQLLEVFTSEILDDYNDFKDEHDGFIAGSGLDADVLNRKMRLLTLASIAASAHQTRALPYSQISKNLQVPAEDVEMWVIDVIRAGLVEGKLSQLNKTFLIHRSTYRVFGDNQWREVDARLQMWRNSLLGVLSVVRNEKEAFIQAKEQEAREAEAKVNGNAGMGGAFRRQPQRAVEVDE